MNHWHWLWLWLWLLLWWYRIYLHQLYSIHNAISLFLFLSRSVYLSIYLLCESTKSNRKRSESVDKVSSPPKIQYKIIVTKAKNLTGRSSMVMRYTHREIEREISEILEPKKYHTNLPITMGSLPFCSISGATFWAK